MLMGWERHLSVLGSPAPLRHLLWPCCGCCLQGRTFFLEQGTGRELALGKARLFFRQRKAVKKSGVFCSSSQHQVAAEPGLWRQNWCLVVIVDCDGMLPGATWAPVRAEVIVGGFAGLGSPQGHRRANGDSGDGIAIAPTWDFLPSGCTGLMTQGLGPNPRGSEGERVRPSAGPCPGAGCGAWGARRRREGGGCEAEARPVSGKLSHLFGHPIWATPQPVLGSSATPIPQPRTMS